MVFHDEEHGNTAMIEEVKIFPYKGAPRKQAGFRMITSGEEKSFPLFCFCS